MKLFSFVATVVLAALVGAGVSGYALRGASSPVKEETAYERVLRTNTLRCGYWIYPPTTTMDTQTHKLDGFAVGIVEEMAQRLGLKVEWTEEVTFGTMLTGLETNRYDAVCTGSFITAGRSRHAAWTVPFVFSGVVPVVRADDDRFDGDLSRANAPDVTLTALDGDITSEIARRDFPNAKLVSIAQNGSFMDNYMNIYGHKADMLFDEPGRALALNDNRDVKVKVLNPDHPLKLLPWSIPVKVSEHELAGMLSGALTEMVFDGSIRRIAKAYDITKGYYFFDPPVSSLAR